jgi:hypothetical protein
MGRFLLSIEDPSGLKHRPPMGRNRGFPLVSEHILKSSQIQFKSRERNKEKRFVLETTTKTRKGKFIQKKINCHTGEIYCY